MFVGFIVAVLIFAAISGIVVSVDWSRIADPILSLILLVGILYWVTTLLPGPIRKVGRAAGRQLGRALRRRNGQKGGH